MYKVHETYPLLVRQYSICYHPYFDLVGGTPTPLKNMSSSVGMMKFPILVSGKIKFMFQTTNQLLSSIGDRLNFGFANLRAFFILWALLENEINFFFKKKGTHFTHNLNIQKWIKKTCVSQIQLFHFLSFSHPPQFQRYQRPAALMRSTTITTMELCK